VREECALRLSAVSCGVALVVVTFVHAARAQTAPATPPESPPALHIEFSTPQPMELRLDQGSPFSCEGVCQMELAPGRHRLDAEPSCNPELHHVRRTLRLSTDSRVQIVPGRRLEHKWGVGLVSGGGATLGVVAIALAAWALSGQHPDVTAQVVTVSLLGVGAAATTGGIYLLVHSRGRVTIDPLGPAQPVAPPKATGVGLDVGWRF